MVVLLAPGVWLLASLNSHETAKGVRLKFQDVECYRSREYEYSDYDALREFNEWKPPPLSEIKKEEEKLQAIITAVATDDYSDKFADELGLRSHRNQSTGSDMENVDLSYWDYDVVDVLQGVTNTTLNFNASTVETERTNETAIPKPNALNGTELKGVNLTAVTMLNQTNSSMSRIENTTTNSVLLKNDNATLNSSVSGVVLNLDNVTASETENTTLLDDTATLILGNVSSETSNHILTLPETTNLSATLPEIPIFFLGSVEESEEKLTRGDVFSYSVPQPPSSTNNLNRTSEGDVTLPPETEDLTTPNPLNLSAAGTNLSMAAVSEVNSSSLDKQNSTGFELKSAGNETVNDTLITAAQPESGTPRSPFEIPTTPSNFSLEYTMLNETNPLQNVTANNSNSSGDVDFNSWEDVTYSTGQSNQTSSVGGPSNKTMISGNMSLSSGPGEDRISEELSASESSEEVLIYLKENNTAGIKTTSVIKKGHNWTYEGTHQMVPMEIPDHMHKYLGKEYTPKKAPKMKKVNRRQRPQKGQGMKTKRRKEYKPLVNVGLPFSPRGFNPGMSPRGSRPVSTHTVQNTFSDEEGLINMPVVIGVPRPDFSDYELYVPGDEPDHFAQDVNADEYEYVNYKDPYSSHEDVKNLNLDDTTKYYLKHSGPNVKTYFISAEEVEWDYAGYGQK